MVLRFALLIVRLIYSNHQISTHDLQTHIFKIIRLYQTASTPGIMYITHNIYAFWRIPVHSPMAYVNQILALSKRYVLPQHITALNDCRTRWRAFWRTGCALWSTSVRSSWWEDVASSAFIFAHHVVLKRKATRKTLVANWVVQCVVVPVC